MVMVDFGLLEMMVPLVDDGKTLVFGGVDIRMVRNMSEGERKKKSR